MEYLNINPVGELIKAIKLIYGEDTATRLKAVYDGFVAASEIRVINQDIGECPHLNVPKVNDNKWECRDCKCPFSIVVPVISVVDTHRLLSIERLQWWQNNLQYKAPEQVDVCLRAMFMEFLNGQ
jgi:hypothetical protein